MKLKMTIEEAIEFADEWSKGMTLHEGSKGWRVVCLLLAEEVRRLTPIEVAAKKTVTAFEAHGNAKQVSAAVPGDLQARCDMLKSWLVEADASNDRLRTHLNNTLEIAYTWQPGYATKIDRDTLALAAQAIGYEPPNAGNQR